MAKPPKRNVSLIGRLKSFNIVRKLARAVPGLGAMAGGVRQSAQAQAAAGPWSMLVFGVPQHLRNDVDRAFPEIRKLFVARRAEDRVVDAEFRALGHKAVLCWGSSMPPSLQRLVREEPDLRIAYIYSGPFDIPSMENPLRSYVLDWSGLYINSRRGCDLEAICNAFPFEDHPALVKACDEMCERLLEPPSEPADFVAVIVQDRTDQAFAFAAQGEFTSDDLIDLARRDYPDAPIRVVASVTPERLEELEQKLPNNIEFAADDEALEVLCQARHVYTFNAPLGAAAVLARRPVTVLAPCFYAGYGLTEDRCEVPRRRRQISREHFATAMFALYLRWMDGEGRLRFPEMPLAAQQPSDVAASAGDPGSAQAPEQSAATVP